MTSYASKFLNLVLKFEGYVTHGDKIKGRILGCGDIGYNSSIIIQNIFFVNV